MWFLQTETLLIISAACAISALLRFFAEKTGAGLKLVPVLSLTSLAALFLISKRLFFFYVVYIAAGLVMCSALKRIKSGRKTAFVFFCILSAAPLVVSRLLPAEISGLLVLTGLAFNMLKAIDALYYVYYTGEGIDAVYYSNFMLFLPEFIAGPVFRYRDYVNSLNRTAILDSESLAYVVKRLIRGYFKKVVISVLLLQIFNIIRENHDGTLYSLSLIVLSYLILYTDLSGYSDIAIALGRVCGIVVPDNFKKPWTAPSFSIFWRSWHVTVSDFIREHVYIVISGKKLSKWHSGIIALCTMILMLVWHEFSVLYIIAGLYNGILLMLENFFGKTTFNRRSAKKPVYIARCVFVNFMFAVNTLIFTLPADEIVRVLTGLFR